MVAVSLKDERIGKSSYEGKGDGRPHFLPRQGSMHVLFLSNCRTPSQCNSAQFVVNQKCGHRDMSYQRPSRDDCLLWKALCILAAQEICLRVQKCRSWFLRK
jgi:hypothetical protein